MTTLWNHTFHRGICDQAYYLQLFTTLVFNVFLHHYYKSIPDFWFPESCECSLQRLTTNGGFASVWKYCLKFITRNTYLVNWTFCKVVHVACPRTGHAPHANPFHGALSPLLGCAGASQYPSLACTLALPPSSPDQPDPQTGYYWLCCKLCNCSRRNRKNQTFILACQGYTFRFELTMTLF